MQKKHFKNKLQDQKCNRPRLSGLCIGMTISLTGADLPVAALAPSDFGLTQQHLQYIQTDYNRTSKQDAWDQNVSPSKTRTNGNHRLQMQKRNKDTTIQQSSYSSITHMLVNNCSKHRVSVDGWSDTTCYHYDEW